MGSTPNNSPSANKTPPLHARLFWYVLTPAELALLKAMVEHCWDGSVIWASVKRLAAYSKLDERTVQNLMHGWDQKRKDKETKQWVIVKHHVGLIQRGVLTEIAKANPAKRRPVTYRLNEAALVEDPSMFAYRSQELQEPLPGIDLAAVPGQPVRPRQKRLLREGYPAPRPRQNKLPGMNANLDESYGTDGQAPLVKPFHQSGETISLAPLVKPFHQSGETISPNYLIDSRRSESADGAGCVSVCEVVEKGNLPTTSEKFPKELAEGLREFVPGIDSAAIERIWTECRKNAPDCAAGEILSFAEAKAYYLPKASNPTGFMISALVGCVTVDAIKELRQKREYEDQQHVAELARKQVEDERHAAEMVRWKRLEELEKQAAADLESLPDEQKQELKKKGFEKLQASFPKVRERWTQQMIDEHVYRMAVKDLAEQLEQTMMSPA